MNKRPDTTGGVGSMRPAFFRFVSLEIGANNFGAARIDEPNGA
jgi:hypothetical protein